jgi:hypothetical protein
MAVLILTRYLTFGLLVLLITLLSVNTNVFCQNDKLSIILPKLKSGDVLERRAARNALTDYIDNIDEPNREKIIDELLIILNKEENYRLKLGISYSVGRISTFFWKVKNQKEAENNLYELFKQEPDPTLKNNLESALMKAEGLYWDAIQDYNVGRLGNDAVKKAVAKFERIFNDFPESTYASRAHYYLAKYYTRVYLKRKDSSDKRLYADKEEWIAKKSNLTYQDYFKKVKQGKYEHTELINARYYFALNWVLLDKFNNAIEELKKIRESPIKDEQTIYVYEYYYSKGNGNVIDRYFPSEQLANYTIEYLRNHPEYSDDYKEAFVKYLNNFKPKE